MAEKIQLTVDNREVTGKKVKFLRNKGVVPVHLFGHNVNSLSLQGESGGLLKVLSQAGRTRLIELKVSGSSQSHNVMVREIQKDPIRGSLIHVDLYEVNMSEKIKVSVPIALVGESPALKIRENMLTQDLNALNIECLPDKIPDRIQIDISVMKEVDDAVRVKDLNLPDIAIMNDPGVLIAKISIRPIEVVEETKPAAAAAAVAEGAVPAAGEAKAGEGKTEAKAEAKPAGAKGEAKPTGAKPEAKAEKK